MLFKNLLIVQYQRSIHHEKTMCKCNIFVGNHHLCMFIEQELGCKHITEDCVPNPGTVC